MPPKRRGRERKGSAGVALCAVVMGVLAADMAVFPSHTKASAGAAVQGAPREAGSRAGEGCMESPASGAVEALATCHGCGR